MLGCAQLATTVGVEHASAGKVPGGGSGFLKDVTAGQFLKADGAAMSVLHGRRVGMLLVFCGVQRHQILPNTCAALRHTLSQVCHGNSSC